jgi:hypothetical protein
MVCANERRSGWDRSGSKAEAANFELWRKLLEQEGEADEYTRKKGAERQCAARKANERVPIGRAMAF